jgi:hypothetical protein
MNRHGVRKLLGATASGLVPPFAGRRRRRRKGKGVGSALAMMASSVLPQVYNDVKGLFRRKKRDNSMMMDPNGGRRRRRRHTRRK